MENIFIGDDIREVSKRLLGCVLHFPQSSFPIKTGPITQVQWYDVEEKDPETTEDRQGDALLMDPGGVFIFEAMGNVVILVSALNENTRACVRINAVQGVAERAHLLARALGVTSINRGKYNGHSLVDPQSPLYITPPTIEVPEAEAFTPRRSNTAKGFQIKL